MFCFSSLAFIVLFCYFLNVVSVPAVGVLSICETPERLQRLEKCHQSLPPQSVE